jgi:predicted aldo/keto reductase-like oxidoreductase
MTTSREMTIQKRVLGKSGLKATRIGFGGIPIQRLSDEEAVEVVKRSHDLGINFFDTARAYTTSEERIGKALRDVRDDLFIATKSVHRDKEGLLKDLETSLDKLQTGWIDLYQLHMISKENEWEKVKGPSGALEGLIEAKDAGKINHLGVTSHNPELMMDVLREGFFETVMIPYNYLTHRPADGLIPLCGELNVGVIVMKPFGGGAIANVETALKYVLGNEGVDVVIPGMMSVEEIEENLAVGSGDYKLSGEDLGLIERDRGELGSQFCRACDYCRPCPQGIPISTVLRTEDQFLKLTGWTPRLIKQVLEAEPKVGSCVKCGQCEERCPYELPIRDLLPVKMRSLMDLLAAHEA